MLSISIVVRCWGLGDIYGLVDVFVVGRYIWLLRMVFEFLCFLFEFICCLFKLVIYNYYYNNNIKSNMV